MNFGGTYLVYSTSLLFVYKMQFKWELLLFTVLRM